MLGEPAIRLGSLFVSLNSWPSIVGQRDEYSYKRADSVSKVL